MKLNKITEAVKNLDFKMEHILNESIRMSPSAYKSVDSNSDIIVGFECEFIHNEISRESDNESRLESIESFDDIEDHDEFNDTEWESMKRAWWYGDEWRSSHGVNISFDNGYKFEDVDVYNEVMTEFLDENSGGGTLREYIDEESLKEELFDDFFPQIALALSSEWDAKLDIVSEEEDGYEDIMDEILEELEMNHAEILESFIKSEYESEYGEWLREQEEDNFYEIESEKVEKALEEEFGDEEFFRSEWHNVQEYMGIYSSSDYDDDEDSAISTIAEEISEFLGVKVITQDYHGNTNNGGDWYLEPDSSTE